MPAFGLIGKSLSHSFSKSYFEKKFQEQRLDDYSYDNFELEKIEDFPALLKQKQFKGLNVTIPYKESIIPFLDELNAGAKEIGAVNCINFVNNRMVGYNTDVYGFAQSIKPFLDTNHQRALILGTGGASKSIAYALKKIGLQVFYVTSGKEKKTQNTFFYPEINDRVMEAFKFIVNTTPLGTFPNTEECPNLPYQLFTPKHFAYDLVYNPPETRFLRLAKEKGAIAMNGLSMLQLQAEKSWEIWNTHT
jgi:shikimate dehydrogenase